jgi:hypothetical protein
MRFSDATYQLSITGIAGDADRDRQRAPIPAFPLNQGPEAVSTSVSEGVSEFRT